MRPQIDAELLDGFSAVISRKTGLRIRAQDSSVLRNAIRSRTGILRIDSPAQYLKAITEETPKSALELKELASLLVAGETYFFRDRGQFEILKARVIPDLIEKRRTDRRLAIWCAGCSTGEEPYSVAILLDEFFPDLSGWGWEILVIGTDINEASIDKARSALYGTWSFRRVDPAEKARYFHPARGGLWEIDERIRPMVAFMRRDLLNDAFPDAGGPFHDIDLIICRNVFIYYTREAVREIASKFSRTLRPGGYLMTGHGELFSVRVDGLKARSFPESVVYERVEEWPSERPAGAPSAVQAAFDPGPAPVLRRPLFLKARSAAPVKEAAVQRAAPSVEEAERRLKAGDYRAAIEAAGAALLESPGDFRALCVMAASYANAGEHEKARLFISKAAASERFAAAPYFLLAHIEKEAGAADEAREALKKVIYLDPASIPAYLELASIYEDEGEADRAARLRRSALDCLRALPEDSIVEPYEEMTAKELIESIEKLL